MAQRNTQLLPDSLPVPLILRGEGILPARALSGHLLRRGLGLRQFKILLFLRP
jgi:hypothetical protein